MILVGAFMELDPFKYGVEDLYRMGFPLVNDWSIWIHSGVIA